MSNTTRPRKATNNAKPDIHALLGEATRAERTVNLCLRGDLQAEWDELRTRFDELGDAPASRMVDGAQRRRLAQQMADVEERMRAATVPFRLRALPRREWQALTREHRYRTGPDGKVLPEDAMLVNSETFFEPLVRACVVEPELSDDEWTVLLEDKLTDRQFDVLAAAAWGINRKDVDVPFSSAASRILRSDSASKPQSDSA